jgi:hypothetical protein
VIGSLVAGLGGGAFFAIGIAALIAPSISSAQYGLPTTDRAALALVRALGSRDLALGIIILLLLAARNRDALELVLAVSILAAAGDLLAVTSGRSHAGPRQLGVHVAGAAALCLAWRLVRSGI